MGTISKYVSKNKALSIAQILIILAIILENIALALPFYVREGILTSIKAIANSYTVQGNWSVIILLSSFATVYSLLSGNDIFLLIFLVINLAFTKKCFKAYAGTRWMLFSHLEHLGIGAKYLQKSNIILLIGIILYAILKYVFKLDFNSDNLISKGDLKIKVKNIIDDCKNSCKSKKALYIFSFVLIISVFMVFKENKLMGTNVKVPAFGVSALGAYLTLIFGIYILNSLLNNKYDKVKIGVIIEIMIKILFFRKGQVLEHDMSTSVWTTISLSLGYCLYTIAIIGCAIVLVRYLSKKNSNN